MSKPADKPEIVKREVGERVDVLCSFEPTTVKDLGDGVFEAIITTASVDRHNENIITSGIDTANWMSKNPVVLYGHDYSGLPIGKGLSLKANKNKLTARFQLATDIYPFADTVAQMIKGGYLNATSIGGIVKRWSEDYQTIEQMEMVEFSIVPVPANAEAIISGRSLEKITGKSMDTVKAEFEDFSRKVLLDKLAGMGEDETKNAIKVLKNLVDRLEESAETPLVTDVKQVNRIRHFTLKDAKAVATQAEKVIKTLKISIKA